MAFSKTIFNGATGILVSEGSEYQIEGYVGLFNDPINLPELLFLGWKPVTYTIADLTTVNSLDRFSPTGSYIKLTTIFTAKATEEIKIGLFQVYDNEGTNTTGVVDSLTVKGPLNKLTEQKTIIYDSGCLFENYPVKFLDSLGGYSYWTFRTYRDEGVQFGQNNQVRNNIFADWSTDFKNAQAQDTFTNSESFETVTLRAEKLTEQQAKDLFELVRSVRCYDNRNPDKPKILLIDKSSINITQGEKLYNLTFNARSTFVNYRQRQ